MSAPSVDMKDVLVADGVGVFGATSGSAIYLGEAPDQPNLCTTLFDRTVRQPLMPISELGPGPIEKSVEFPAIQIQCRAIDYAAAYAKAREVVNSLVHRASFTNVAGDYKYLCITQQSDPLHIGEDDKNRQIFSLNIMAQRTPIIP